MEPSAPPSSPVEPVQLLWTGGWDSSFRLMHLLLVEHRPVRPVYVVHAYRRSTLQEIQTMDRMREELLARLDDPSLLAPTVMVDSRHYPPGPELVSMNESIRRRVWMGSQYLSLAGVAEALGWEGVELSIEASPRGPEPFERIVFADDRGTLTDAPEAQLFRYWSFPLLATTKARMAEVAREHGFLDLLAQRWFCHDPLLDRPCGRCRPCRQAHREGVRFAHPVLARARTGARAAQRLRGRLRGRVRRLAGRSAGRPARS